MLLQQKPSQTFLSGAMSSIFIEGMVQGTLDPDAFSAFELQDAVYLGKTRDILRETATMMTPSHPSFADMYNI